ncbi:hypothetical protein [Nocardioides gilvus]|uniref:hypothetical protein n=1 Tax=Nocardioides gilvus TaxID=1735589 RepID=UPI000D746339|nr:hypothetical protein [Nocardioides gilvus]
MSRPLALRRAGAALALPLLLGLTSCADDSNSEDSQSSVSESTPTDDSSESPDGAGDNEAEADAKDAPQGSKKSGNSSGTQSPLTTLDVEAGATVDGKKFAALTKWALDNATTADIDLDSSAQGGVSGSGSVDHTTTPLSLQLTIEANGSKGDVRLVDGAIYMSTPGMGGGKYLKLDVSEGAGTGLGLPELDPSRELERGLGKKKFTYRGVETIDGTPARRFSTADVDIWFDESGFLRRVKRDAGDKGVTTATYSNWGKEVDISAPPADQVQEMPSLPSMPQAPKG